MRNRIIAGVAATALLVSALAVWRPASGAAKADILGNPQARYVLTPVQGIIHENLGSGPVSNVIKMDSVTGETWILHPQGWKAIKQVP